MASGMITVQRIWSCGQSSNRLASAKLTFKLKTNSFVPA